MDYPFYFNLCPDELELRRSLVVPEFVQSDHLPQLHVDEKIYRKHCFRFSESRRYEISGTFCQSWQCNNEMTELDANQFTCTPRTASSALPTSLYAPLMPELILMTYDADPDLAKCRCTSGWKNLTNVIQQNSLII